MAVTEQDAKKFIGELIAVCKKHGLSLSHEDHQGSFLVVNYSKEKAEWLRQAYDARKD